jgi:1-phosphatidylinositol-3-phosphate 5-kinase
VDCGLADDSIADLVKRFQDSVGDMAFPVVEPVPDRPRSSQSIRRSSHRVQPHEESDSEKDVVVRPRLRRGRTEQPQSRHRDTTRPLMSDGDRSYAANASRTASSYTRSNTLGLEIPRPPSRLKSPNSLTVPLPTSGPSSGRTSPDSSGIQSAMALSKTTSTEGKPRITGKGKMPKRSETPAGRQITGPLKGPSRRLIAGSTGSRVSSIARHFDRLSREAERDRQKRISMAKGKRARPVGVTKAKVEVFDNLRDAFKDEFDTDSSEADNEEDDEGDGDSGDSTKPRRKSTSPVKPGPLAVPAALTESPKALESEPLSVSTSASSITGASVLSETNTDVSFTDRLQIELPPFDTSAPLPSEPVTPHLSCDTADEGRMPVSQLSVMSESELSSGGERSSILKTLSGLWAFRAGEFTPLEYPL